MNSTMCSLSSLMKCQIFILTASLLCSGLHAFTIVSNTKLASLPNSIAPATYANKYPTGTILKAKAKKEDVLDIDNLVEEAAKGAVNGMGDKNEKAKEMKVQEVEKGEEEDKEKESEDEQKMFDRDMMKRAIQMARSRLVPVSGLVYINCFKFTKYIYD